MMGIYIKGMEMPVIELEWKIRLGADGKWYATDTNAETSDGEWHEIIPVPPHGRLIDADALEAVVEAHYKHLKISRYDRDLLLHYLDVEMAPTIILAEEESAKGINVPTKKEEATDYKKLIDSLRICGDSVDVIDECSFEECIQHESPIDPLCMKALCHKAADAIEELRRREKFHAFIWKTLGFGYMRQLEELYQEEEESDV